MGDPTLMPAAGEPETVSPVSESLVTRIVLMGVAFSFLAIFLVLPLIVVFEQALSRGIGTFVSSLGEPDTVAAIKLTLLVAAISVPLNLVFGVAAAWAIAKFEFKGKAFLTTLIDLPFSVSPVIAGLVYVLLSVPAARSGRCSAPMA